MEKKCCICEREFIGMGNNPEPIMEGCCCDDCNSKFVIPARLYEATVEEINYFEVARSPLEYRKLKMKLQEKNFEKYKMIQYMIQYMSLYQNPENEEKVALIIV